jgi:prepilin-type N-terminal cleavage/methylation domain-containing protein
MERVFEWLFNRAAWIPYYSFNCCAENQTPMPIRTKFPSFCRPRREVLLRIRLARGFTLVEMLTVIGIAAIMASLVVPAFISINSSQGVTQALNDLSGTLELARSTAMSQNTYVFVGLVNTTDAVGNSELIVGAVRSMDGTFNTAVGNLSPIAKLRFVHNTQMIPLSGAVAPPTATVLKNILPSPDTAESLSTAASSISFSVNGQVFTNSVLVVTPQGQATLSSNVTSSTPFTDQIEIAVQPARGTIIPASTKDGFVIWMSGGSGSLRYFRP